MTSRELKEAVSLLSLPLPHKQDLKSLCEKLLAEEAVKIADLYNVDEVQKSQGKLQLLLALIEALSSDSK